MTAHQCGDERTRQQTRPDLGHSPRIPMTVQCGAPPPSSGERTLATIRQTRLDELRRREGEAVHGGSHKDSELSGRDHESLPALSSIFRGISKISETSFECRE
jgi:hypothetical protein